MQSKLAKLATLVLMAAFGAAWAYNDVAWKVVSNGTETALKFGRGAAQDGLDKDIDKVMAPSLPTRNNVLDEDKDKLPENADTMEYMYFLGAEDPSENSYISDCYRVLSKDIRSNAKASSTWTLVVESVIDENTSVDFELESGTLDQGGKLALTDADGNDLGLTGVKLVPGTYTLKYTIGEQNAPAIIETDTRAVVASTDRQMELYLFDADKYAIAKNTSVDIYFYKADGSLAESKKYTPSQATRGDTTLEDGVLKTDFSTETFTDVKVFYSLVFEEDKDNENAGSTEMVTRAVIQNMTVAIDGVTVAGEAQEALAPADAKAAGHTYSIVSNFTDDTKTAHQPFEMSYKLELGSDAGFEAAAITVTSPEFKTAEGKGAADYLSTEITVNGVVYQDVTATVKASETSGKSYVEYSIASLSLTKGNVTTVKLSVTPSDLATGKGNFALTATPKQQDAAAIPDGSTLYTTTVEVNVKAKGTIDFDDDGYVDNNDAMYLYNYVLNGCPSKADDWFTADSLLDFTDSNATLELAQKALTYFQENLSSLDFDEKNGGEPGNNAAMYLYNYVLNGCPSKADDWFTADSLLDFTDDAEKDPQTALDKFYEYMNGKQTRN